ncbi:MAG: RHS repeat domain-containing protein [Bacteriovoracia bacterium]
MNQLESFSGEGVFATYSRDNLGQLKSVTLNDQVISYALDWDGRRVAKRLNGVNVSRHTFESPLRVAMETDEAGAQKHYVYGSGINSPDYMILNGENFRLIKDHLGSPRLVISANTGTIVQRMDFNEWGEVLFDSNPGFQGFGFAGGLYDQDTKLVKFGARDYSPAVGRWLSKDPILFAGGDANLYGYVLQDPVNLIDPSGKIPLAFILFGVVLLIDPSEISPKIEPQKKPTIPVPNEIQPGVPVEEIKEKLKENKEFKDRICLT